MTFGPNYSWRDFLNSKEERRSVTLVLDFSEIWCKRRTPEKTDVTTTLKSGFGHETEYVDPLPKIRGEVFNGSNSVKKW